jgi:hypothetical protein
MPDIIQSQPGEDEESFLPDYASFILRCWTNRQGRVRARLIDVHSGVSHPVASLAALPELVHRLVAKDLPSPSPEDTGQT